MCAGVRPIIWRACAPTACTAPVRSSIATTEGSKRTIPSPRRKTTVFAVPRSTASWRAERARPSLTLLRLASEAKLPSYEAPRDLRPRHRLRPRARAAAVPLSGAADAGALVCRPHPARLLRRRAARAAAVRRMALPAHGRRALQDDRAALDADHGGA